MHRLSIVIVTLNSGAFLPACLGSIVSRKSSIPLEVIVVDNASTDDTVGYLKKSFPQVRLIVNDENVGFNRANNRGIRESSGDLVLLLNPDTKVEEGALESLAEFLLSENDLAAAGPKILNGDGSLQRTGVSFPTLWNVLLEAFFLNILFPRSRIFGRHRRLYEHPDAVVEVDYLQGSCLMVKREVFDKVGLLDERFFMYFDELEFCYRCKLLGWKVKYDPAAVVTHYGGGGTAFYDEVRLMHFHRSFLTFLKKHYGPARTFLFRTLLLLRALIRWLLFSCASVVPVRRQSEYRSRSRGYGKVARFLIGGS